MRHQAMYKCKRCGEVFGIGRHDLHMEEISNGKSQQAWDALLEQYKEMKSVTMFYPHKCDSFCIGYAEFIGMQPE